MSTHRMALGWITVASIALLIGDPSTAVGQGQVDAGRQVFEANCAMCHGDDASGMMGMHPSLRGAVERLSREGVEVTIRNGRDTNPPMPAFGERLTADQVGAVIAYLESLPPGPRNFGPEMDDRGMMGGRMMGGGWWTFAAGMLAGLLVALLAGGVVWLVRGRSGGSSPGPARRELDRRYAAGELSREQYLQRRDDLG